MSLNAKLRVLGKRNRCRSAINLFYIISSYTLDVSYTKKKKSSEELQNVFEEEKCKKQERSTDNQIGSFTALLGFALDEEELDS